MGRFYFLQLEAEVYYHTINSVILYGWVPFLTHTFNPFSFYMRRIILIALLALILGDAGKAQQEFSIWPGAAPGSESWTGKEQMDSASIPGDPLAYNIVQPGLIYFPAHTSIANGTAVIICPGGSFSYLHIKTEGVDVARWLNQKGISAFVLKYRVVHSETTHPMQEKSDRMKDTANARKLVTPVVAFAIADGKQAIVYVRQHASELSLNPEKIGIMGFSAGGALASSSAFDDSGESRPDFAAPIYPFVPPFLPAAVPKDAPPLFIAAATDDEYHLVPMSLGLYAKWLSAGRSAELHIYSKGGHGFGMNQQHQPSDTWIERFGDWLRIQGFL
jgi:acetyl esterase/lipase